MMVYFAIAALTAPLMTASNVMLADGVRSATCKWGPETFIRELLGFLK